MTISRQSERDPFTPLPERYQSPEGTYERILKVILENVGDMTDAEGIMLMYLTTKPPGWIVNERQLVRDLRRTAYWVQKARAGLHRRGLLTEVSSEPLTVPGFAVAT